MNALLLYWKPLAVVLILGLVAVGGYRAGENSVRADYEERAVKASSDYIAALAKANAERDAEIAKRTDLQTAASAVYQKLTKERQDAEDKLAHAVSTGTRKLYVAAPQLVTVPCPKLPPIPAELPQPSQLNWLEELLTILSVTADGSTPSKPSTTAVTPN
jgi:hypothetical protein